MCRLYLQYNINEIEEDSKDHILHFLESGTPKNHNGFGFGWINNKTDKWSLYKTPLMYKDDAKLLKKLDTIVKSNVIIGHIRANDHPKFLSNDLNNSHPFLHKNQIFCHNGSTRKIEDVSIYNSIKSKIDKKYLHFIKGSTTSELLFYLFLSIKDAVVSDKKNKDEIAILTRSVNNMFHSIQHLKLKSLANTIFADDEYIIVTKYKSCDLKNERIKSLFYEKTDGGIIVTSFPIFTKMIEFRDNSIMIINIKSGDMHIRALEC